MGRGSNQRLDGRRGSATVGWRSILRHLAASKSVVTTTSIAVFLTTLIVSLTPGLFEQVSSTALHERLVNAGPSERNINVVRVSRFPADTGDDPFAQVRDAAEAFGASQLPESVLDLVIQTVFVAESPRYEASVYPEGDTDVPTFLTMRYVQDVEDHITLTRGNPPGPTGSVAMRIGADCPPVPGDDPALSPDEVVVDLDDDGVIACENEMVPVFQVAASGATLQAVGVDVGDRLVLAPDTTDARFIAVPTVLLGYRLVLEFTAALEVDDPDDEYWFGDTTLARPGQFINADMAILYGTALMAPEAYARLSQWTATAFWAYTFRYMMDTERITPAGVSALAADIRTMQSEHPTVTSAVSQEYTLRTGLGSILTEYGERRDLTISLLASSMTGLLAVALATMVVLGILATEQGSDATVLHRSRGSSRLQLFFTRALEGALLTLPPGVAAYLLTRVLATVESDLPFQAALFTCLSALLIYTFAGWSPIFAHLGRLLRRRKELDKTSVRQIVFEVLLVVIAIASLALLRRRGVEAGGRFDLLIALGPALLAIAVAIVTLRLYLLPMRFAAWVGERMRGLVTFVGFRRVVQTSRVGRAPLTVILLAVAVSVFAAVVRSSIDQGQARSTWQTVGADARVTGRTPGSALPALLDLSDIEGVHATAPAAIYPAAGLHGSSNDLTRQANLLAVDLEGIAAVSGGTPADPVLPPSMGAEDESADIGSPENPMPAVISGRWPGTRPAIGETFTMLVEGASPSFVVVQTRDSFPGLDPSRPSVIASLGAVRTSVAPAVPRATELYVKADLGADEALVEQVAGRAPGDLLLSRRTLQSQLSEEAFASGVDAALDVITLMSAMFAVGAALSSLALKAPARRRDFSYLRTQGLAARQALRLTIIEQLPPTLLAAIVGAFLGVGGALLLAPSIDLMAFTGPGAPAAIEVDVPIVLFVTAGLVVAMTIAVLVFGYGRRGDHLADVLSLGDE